MTKRRKRAETQADTKRLKAGSSGANKAGAKKRDDGRKSQDSCFISGYLVVGFV